MWKLISNYNTNEGGSYLIGRDKTLQFLQIKNQSFVYSRRLQKMHLRQQRHRLLLHEVTQPRRSIREAAIINQDLDSTTENITWPNKLSADTEGDIFLGGLHMIHERDHDKTCGPIMAQGGIQAMETMMFTIDHINQQTWWIPNVTLGKCMNPKYGSLATFRA